MKRPFIIGLLPLLILYLAVFFAQAMPSVDYGDEVRYIDYAENLTKGFFAPRDTLCLWNGPGYPLLLAPFALFKVPWFYAKMLNPVFFFLACLFIYSILSNFMTGARALFFTYLFGLYPPFYAELPYLLTEPFSLMLSALFALLVLKWFQTGGFRFLIFAAVAYAFLALTKVFFGYVMLACLLLSLLFLKWSRTCLKSIPVYVLALLFCSPYLFYTYRLTGRIFYWANSGGSVLYWMTSPYPEEFGDWKSDGVVMTQPELARHRPFFEKIQGLDYVKRDDLMKKQALENLVKYPRKALLNWLANLGRMWLNFPFAYKYQHPKTLLYTAPGALLLAATLFTVYPLVKLRKNLPIFIVHSIGFCLVYLVGHSFLFAEARYLCPLIPFVFIIITYTATNIVKLQLVQKGN